MRESVRDIKFLQSESFYAVAQKKYVFIYDKDGTELQYVPDSSSTIVMYGAVLI